MSDLHTPIIGVPFACDGPGACRICQLIDRDGPDYRPAYRKLFFPDEFPPEALPPHYERPAPQGGAARPNVHMLRLALIHGCDYREPLIGNEAPTCGCEDSRMCFYGNGRVSTSDCLRCVSARNP